MNVFGLVVGVFGTWVFAKQIYTAAMGGYIATLWNKRDTKSQNAWGYRNNVIASIIFLPVMSALAVVDAIHLLSIH